MSQTGVLQQLRAFLLENAVSFREIQHEPTLTSAASAEARGEELRVGGKALVVKIDDTFRLIVLPADRRLDSTALKQHFHAKKTRFANRDELQQLTGLVPGAVPPFGQPILPLPLYVDQALTTNERLAFNAGSLTTSFVMRMADYLQIANAQVICCSQVD